MIALVSMGSSETAVEHVSIDNTLQPVESVVIYRSRRPAMSDSLRIRTFWNHIKEGAPR